MRITLEDIFNISGAVIYYPDLYKSVTSVSIDTRTIKKNSLFVAIKGKNFDGHDYVNEAVKKGAIAVIVNNRKINSFDNLKIPIIAVRNTKIAYGELARSWRKKLKAKVISITGSNGKSTTKEFLSQILSLKYKVIATTSNNNNDIGVPLTIFNANESTEILVLEHGTNHFGEIEYTAKIALPDISLITNIGLSHLEFFKDKKGVLKEKLALFNNTNSNGTIIINADDKLLSKYKTKLAHTTYGFNTKSEVKASKLGTTLDGREKIKITTNKYSFEVELPFLGEANSKNYLAAIAIALKLNFTKKEILSATSRIIPLQKRLQKKEFTNFIIIDDTYNSNPDSVRNALKVMQNFKLRENKIIILGDMFELGKESKKYHTDLVQEIKKIKNCSVYSIGKNMTMLDSELGKNLKYHKHFNSRKSLENYLQKLNLQDSVILVKGSRGMKMEQFVNLLEKRAS